MLFSYSARVWRTNKEETGSWFILQAAEHRCTLLVRPKEDAPAERHPPRSWSHASKESRDAIFCDDCCQLVQHGTATGVGPGSEHLACSQHIEWRRDGGSDGSGNRAAYRALWRSKARVREASGGLN